MRDRGPSYRWRHAKPSFRRVTFSVTSQEPQEPRGHQGSLQSCCYDSGPDDSETPSDKDSSGGPQPGALPLPEDGYQRTTPDGSVGEEEHMENGTGFRHRETIQRDHTERPRRETTQRETRQRDQIDHTERPDRERPHRETR
ncbi:hypothetical protein NHX12_013815 [Muraenolepis orangiensis]|uniref:Uncharacterized protein n=1 Tax=Muraenolepis orangiensis TaxID=630683 RepID=A0A9Q0DCI2_9TELE|nr:hypothetical protein NHX12_013815 [Muraenolepis orangiensis]